MHDQLGGKSMLRDSSEGQIHVHDQLEQMANDLVLDDQPLHRDPEREPFNHRVDRPRWCPGGFDQIAEKASPEVATVGNIRGRVETDYKQEESQVPSLAREAKSR